MSPFHSTDLSKHTFLITGGAGFIGSNIVDYLIKNSAGKIRVLDNLATGYLNNISHYKSYNGFELIEGDIRDLEMCRKCCQGIDYVSHQAALGSVPRSIKDPHYTHAVNSTGFLNMIIAARDANVKRFIYASTSSVYGDHQGIPKKEEVTGNPISPYAASKKTNELYAKVFADTYHMEVIGLRYFNVFGPKQSPEAQYAAVIPLFIKSLMDNQPPFIDGNGEQTRDFTFVDNVVQANIKAMFVTDPAAINRVYNVALGERVSINYLFKELAFLFNSDIKPNYRASRPGDIRDSLADISTAKNLLGYSPEIRLSEGLKQTVEWFRKSLIKTS